GSPGIPGSTRMAYQHCPFDTLLILDFETTSDAANQDYPCEVIQFAIVAYDVPNDKIREDISFNKYVKPVLNRTLTKNCVDFTGIPQRSIDTADTFDVVYEQFQQWLITLGLEEGKFAFVCDSRQDLWRIAQYQMKLSNIQMPAFFRQYINLYKIFTNEMDRMGPKELSATTNIGKMNEYYDLPTIGRAHDAMDDCLNIATILQRMINMGAKVTVNELLTCCASWRRQPLVYNKEWRSSFMDAGKIFERVLPLVVTTIRAGDFRLEMYGVCRYCRKGMDVCGTSHQQTPHDLYKNEEDPIHFAKIAGYY
nr:Chain A, Cell death-related nuclease 4 [Caenorhabditis elegans]3CG7_B Chain B, Cell death-related nuclease 4 [Caenorhabditis elegans]3CM5_A Chain A, Cell death-related nuclease 4 [Caenorhabditis elegans]3CM5_B Chain B, Cell death-related nuclease 4 [Caenorhabditis elegans]3CM6_A Chain A, Cell death-related nuclease 4 [Caenorhabditis elegans]3CM6_B Chain B, Cell death-related nuclease 4 [Caenorhabditis elegans]5DK5_A Chain A, Cell death-related nuclease 4 [Caenorhabditis elegans]5DK5_B Cha